jgi:predicted membrane-bound spermidine synthase
VRSEVLAASAVAFVASFCTLVIELVAGRIMAPYVGVSLYTWTSIIGVVLAGISLGAYLGGMLADRYPRHATLGWLLVGAGLAALAIAPLADIVGAAGFLADRVSLMTRILLITLMVFFVPSLVLGMISPVVVKLTVKDLEHTGNVVGKIYAFSTLGSILGTFATGFFLIEAMGTRTILYGVGAVLVLCAPIFGRLLGGRAGARRGLAAGCLALMAAVLGLLWTERAVIALPFELTRDARGALTAVRLGADTFYKESSYYTLTVYDDPWHEDERVDDHVPVRTLKLDHLIHSYTHMSDPLYLAYDYLRIYEELVAWRKTGQRGPDGRNPVLFVGGGGYTLPRYLDAKYPEMLVDVVEIDPWVTRVAREQLGIDRTRVHSFNADGRWYVMNCTKKYDFIVGDAFNDLSIPYHLTTREFDRHLKNILNEDGLLMALVIDNVRSGHFLPTYLRTLQDVFGESHVHLITLDTRDVTEIGTETAIVVASPRPLDMEDFRRFLDERARRAQAAGDGEAHRGQAERVPVSSVSNVVPRERLQAYMRTRARPPFVLRDDYVPADNLVAPMFEERYGFEKKGD